VSDFKVNAQNLQRLEWHSTFSAARPKAEVPQDRYISQTGPLPSVNPPTELRLEQPRVRHQQTEFLPLSYTPEAPGQVGMPFAQPMEQGRIEFNNVPHLVAGMRAAGDQVGVTSVLENWLSLGERYGCLPGSNQFHELGRAGMPRLSPLLMEEARINPDPELPARAYKVLADDHKLTWCDRYFKQSTNGLNRFCDVDYSHDATMVESGGEFNRERFQGDPARYNPVDLNAHLWRTETDLAKLAASLGRSDEAAQWEQKAADRKNTMLGLMLDPAAGRLYDWNVAEGKRSDCPTLAQYATLSSGMLDPEKDSSLIAGLAADLSNFFQPDKILPVWDLKTNEEASPSQVLDLAEAMDTYKFPDQAQRLRNALKVRLATQTYSEVEDQAARSRLSPTAQPQPFVPVFSPEGQSRLQALEPGKVPTASQVGPLDRRLRQLHPSLLQPEVVKSLQSQGLSEAVYQLSSQPDIGSGEVSNNLKFGDLSLQFPEVHSQELPHGARLLNNGHGNLVVAMAGDHLVIGDRAYNLAQLPDKNNLRIPQDIFENFYLAGGNPAMEKFFHHERSWLGEIPTSPSSAVEALPGKPGWNKMYDLTEKNWPALTIDPSVIASGSAMPIFNRAAVPSLGIFKTQFNWDTLFMARGMQLQGQGPVVAGMADNLLSLLKENGRVPNAARSVYLNKSQPPILPGLVRMSERIREGREGKERSGAWLGEAYGLMAKDYKEFWCKPGERGVTEIKGQNVTLARWGGPNHKFAMDESGFDTTSRFDGKTLDLIPPDLNAFLYRYSKDMEAIAQKLGKTDEAKDWAAQAQQRKDSLIQFCWDDKDGMFRDYRFQGEDQGLQRQEDVLATAAGPLWAGMLDPTIPKEKAMIDRTMQAMALFEKEHGLAATAEDYGHPEMQWNGPSGWAPLHLMAIEAAVSSGSYSQAARWTEKWLDTITNNHEENGVILERYDMVEGGAPPVQKGRYEETQGEGPGFGWTNATIPWALVEVVGGARVQDNGLRMEPVIPPALQGQPVKMTFKDPGGLGSCHMEHNYAGNSFETRLQGDGKWEGFQLLTPPLPPGIKPEGLPLGARLQTVEAEGGQVRYRVELPGIPKTGLHLRFA